MGKLFYGTMTGNTAAVAEAIQAALADLIDEARCIDRAKAESHGLGLFIRALVGLDREAATQAVGRFVSGKTLSSNQLTVKLQNDWISCACATPSRPLV